MIEPSEDSFETMMERKNPSSKQMESSEGSPNTAAEASGSRAQEVTKPAGGSAQQSREPPSGSLQEMEELPIDLLQDMEEPSSGPHQEIEDPPNDLLQDMEESRNGPSQATGDPRHLAAGQIGKAPVRKSEGGQDEQESDTDLWSEEAEQGEEDEEEQEEKDEEEEEEEEEGPRQRRRREAGLQDTVRSITSLYYQMQDLREQQRVAGEILMSGIHNGHLPLLLPFSGDRRDYREFIVLCQLTIQNHPRMFYSDELRVGYVITHLSGMALEWAKKLVEANSPLLESFPGFVAAMSSVFEYQQVTRMAEEAIFNIRQLDRPAAAYISEFQSLVPILNWPDEVLQAHLCQGLNDDIRHYLFRVPQPESLDSLIVLILQIEEKLAERRALLRLPPEARPRNLTWIDSPAPERWSVSSWLPSEVHPSVNRAHIYVLLLVRVNPYNSVAVQALLDSGASSNFMDEQFAQEHYVELYEKQYPQEIQTSDGSLVGNEPVWLYSEPLVCIHQNHHEYIEFDIVPSPNFSVILGINWLRKHSPAVDWAKGRCSFHSPYCLQNCFTPPPPCIALERQGLSLLPGLPPPYSDLADVFNPKEADDETSDQPSSDGSDDLSESEPSELQQAGDSDLDEVFYECRSTAPWEPMPTRMQDTARLHDADWDSQDMLTHRQDYVQDIPELFDQLHGATWFTKLELRGTIVEDSMKIHQVEDVWKAAFGLDFQDLEGYKPFPICADPVVPQSAIHYILKGMLGFNVLAYGQDVIVYSMSQQEHPQHVRQVLVRFRRHHIYCSLDRSQFHRNHMEFLGFVFSPKGVKLHKTVVKTVTGFPIPGSKKCLRRLIDYIFPYRHFIEHFTIIIEPLLRQLRHAHDFYWGAEEQEAFECLKRAFRKAPRLYHPKPQNPFFLETGVTETSLHAALIQVDEQTRKKVYCAFYSRHLSPIEDDYSQQEMRILPIRAAFMVWSRYLENTEEPIMILLDTEDLASLNNDRLTVLLPGHWVFFFSHFNFDVMEWPPREGQPVRLPMRGQRLGEYDPEVPTHPLLLFPNPPNSLLDEEVKSEPAPPQPSQPQELVAQLSLDQLVCTFLLQLGAIQMRAVILHFIRSLWVWKNSLALAALLLMLRMRPCLQQLRAPNPLAVQPRRRSLVLDASLISHRGMANTVTELLLQMSPLVAANTTPAQELGPLVLSPGPRQHALVARGAHLRLRLTPSFWLTLCEILGVRVALGDESYPVPREPRYLELHIVNDEDVVLREARQGDLQRYRQGGLHDGLQDSPQDDQERAGLEPLPRDGAVITLALPVLRQSQAHPAILALLRDTRAAEGRPALLTRGLVARLLLRFLRVARGQTAPSTVRASPPRDEEPPRDHGDRD